MQRLFTALRRLNPPGLSLTAASTLARLDREGPHRLTELATREGVTQPAMTQLVSRLERDGLAARAADPEDGRVVLVEITPAGRELMARRRRIRADHINEILGTLSEDDRRAVDAALPVLNRLADLIPQ
ncbi:MarR family transcriptional regulator [Catellatospora sp. KI3]|uniref:MarR family winged helix-turn-helix transcriptional regulator n=1 Tax=Catellatospora sp. KI3 TaxID=3041620 RepID=UPI002482496A|nr:MarR family transcriptional regulator [Catellatospora sp. KI3]MDI1466118.1 MarR family transcriptional regulator [Catellatospora sp. KI3]